jgi:hypothetical protein
MSIKQCSWAPGSMGIRAVIQSDLRSLTKRLAITPAARMFTHLIFTVHYSRQSAANYRVVGLRTWVAYYRDFSRPRYKHKRCGKFLV